MAPLRYGSSMSPDDRTSLPRSLNVGTVFPGLLRAPHLGVVSLDQPAHEARIQSRRIADHLCSLVQDPLEATFGSLFPMLLGLQHDLISKSDLVRIGRAGERHLTQCGIHFWVELLALRPHDLRQMAHSRGDSLDGLVHFLVERTFEELVPPPSGATPEPMWFYPASVSIDGAATRDSIYASNTAEFHSLPLRDVLPDLTALGINRVPQRLLPLRLQENFAHTAWTDFLNLSLDDIRQLPGVGAVTIEHLRGNLVGLHQRISVDRRLASTGQRPSHNPDPGTAWGSLAPLINWATAELDITTIGEIFQLSLDPAPPSVTAYWERISEELPITPVIQRRAGLLLTDAARDLSGLTADALHQRHRLDRAPESFESIGQRYGVTGERARKAVADYLSRWEARVAFHDMWTVRARAEEVGRRLGSIFRPDSAHVEETLRWAVRDVDDDAKELALVLLAHIAGPYRFIDGWASRSSRGDIRVADVARQLFGDVGSTPEEWRARGAARGILPDATDELVAEFVPSVLVDGTHYRKGAKAADLAHELIARAGRPLTFEEIWVLLQHRTDSIQSARNSLSADSRLQRTKKTEWALAEWELPEYSGIASAMDQIIEDAGGRVHVDTMAGILAEQFGVPSSSFTMMRDRPRWSVEDGYITLRTDPYMPDTNLRGVTGLRMTSDERLAWWIPVDRDIARGSGRRMPEALAGRLGLLPNGDLNLQSSHGEVRLKWLDTSAPNVGSLRDVALSLHAAVGDILVLIFEPENDEIEIRLVTEHEMEDDPLRAVARLIGTPRPESGEDALEALAHELGVTATTRSSLLFRCAARLEDLGEPTLASKVESSSS